MREKFFVDGMTTYSTSKPPRYAGKSCRVGREGPKGTNNPAPTAARDRKMGMSPRAGKAPR